MASALAHLERMDEAGAAVARLLELAPDLTVSGLRERWPLRNKDKLEMILDGLHTSVIPQQHSLMSFPRTLLRHSRASTL